MFFIFLLFKIWITAVLAGDSSDDEKHDYNIELRKVSIEIMSEMYFNKDTHFLVVMFNETKSVLKAILDFKRPPPDDLVLNIMASKFEKSTNQFVQKFSQNHVFCHFIENNHYIMDSFYKESDFPRACPIHKGKYYVKNMVLDNSEFPKHLEASSWRAELELTAKNNMGPPYLLLYIDADIEPIEDDEEGDESE